MIDRVKSLLARQAKPSSASSSSAAQSELPVSAAKLYALAPKPEQKPEQKGSAPDQLPSLADLREHEPKAREPQKKGDDRVSERELEEFEEAIASIQDSPDASIEEASSRPLSSGFFSEFERALSNEQVHEVAEEIIKEDILHRMKQFHQHREQGKRYQVTSAQLRRALSEKLAELKGLERGWFERKRELEALGRHISLKEQEIDKRTAELKELLGQFRSAAVLERESPAEQAFHCTDGTQLRSLLELRQALMQGSDEAWANHFSSEGNSVATWVGSIFNDASLAARLSSARSREELLELLYNL